MYDVVVIGSGYGGSVVAARLAGQAKVLLVERGRRYLPGDFPESITGLLRAYRRRDQPLGLWSMRLGAGTGNAEISALGGASLFNYGITVRPPEQTFAGWGVTPRELDPYFLRALEVLAPTPYPRRHELADAGFIDRVEPGRRVDLDNTIDWDACTLCGNCPSGCNVGAKRSLDFTYLPMAVAGGVEITVETEAVACRSLAGGGWELVLRPTTGGPTTRVATRQIVLAAGTFGSLEFLQRVRADVPLTGAFGSKMSMNGDALFFLYNTAHPLSGEHGAPLTTSARMTLAQGEKERRVTIISGRLPKLVAPLLGGAFALLAPLLPGSPDKGGDESWHVRLGRQLRDLRGIEADGALAQTFMYKVNAQDAAQGHARFEDGQAVMDWPDYPNQPVLRFAHEQLERWAEQMGGRVVAELGHWPILRGRSLGVHALGGCALGETPDVGVVDTRLRLFRPDGALHPGFRVVDASVLPGALGVPSSLTIAAFAERAAEDLLEELAS